MKCAWSALIMILPIWMRQEVDKLGRDNLLELRLRLGLPPELIMIDKTICLNRKIHSDDLKFCVNVASQYSPWATSTIAQGYLTIEGGHRIGLSGQATMKEGKVCGFGTVTSLCIRVAREFPGISNGLWKTEQSILIIGRPGSGKTTLLRDLVAQKSNLGGYRMCVIDERGELFPFNGETPCFGAGSRTDVISGTAKRIGAEMAIRNMNPDVLVFDEITAAEDCDAMLHAGWCGIKLIATAHAASRADLVSRAIYKPILHSGLFETLVVMRPNRTWTVERIQ